MKNNSILKSILLVISSPFVLLILILSSPFYMVLKSVQWLSRKEKSEYTPLRAVMN